jgi:type IV secretory pathway VirJ component
VDLNRILQHYSALWKRTEVDIIGYSFGADVLPFMLNRIPADSLQKIRVITFLGLSSTADFQFHLTDWISSRTRSTSQMVRPEVEKLRGRKCFVSMELTTAMRPESSIRSCEGYSHPGGIVLEKATSQS